MEMDPLEFEEAVRSIARTLMSSLWEGASIEDGQERDGVFVGETQILLVEATMSTKADKAKKDAEKLKRLADKLGQAHPYKSIRALFVTSGEPTAHQRQEVAKVGQPVSAISYLNFRSQIVNSREYFEARSAFAFGSARDPETDGYEVQDRYVELDFVQEGSQDVVSRRETSQRLRSGERLVLLGEFGTGKSMTLRQIFFDIRKDVLSGRADDFCLHINLGDHHGQSNPAEALMRHAVNLGLPNPGQLIRAWKMGRCHLLLDGFDEVYTPGWAASDRRLVETRRKSVELIRRFLSETPMSSGVLVAGRKHFFDSYAEMRSALGLQATAAVVSATDFTEQQVQQYLSNRKWSRTLPAWLPRKPLLIGYFASRGLFDEIEEVAHLDPGAGWDMLIDRICKREARIEAGLDEGSIRAILERLASGARTTSSGLGPVEFHAMSEVFKELQGYVPDEAAFAILQRLPGLRINDTQKNTRSFVDDDFLDALRAGDVLHFVESPQLGAPSNLEDWQTCMGPVGLEVLVERCARHSVDSRHVGQALVLADKRPVPVEALKADLVRVLYALGDGPSKRIVISDIHIPAIRISEEGAGATVFSDCLIDVLDVSEVPSTNLLPVFDRCSIAFVDGAAGIDDLDRTKMVGTDIHEFGDSAANSSAILQLDISDRRRVILTVLRKIFVQSGHSRKESALYRGALTQAQKELIPGVLSALEAQGAISRTKRKDAILWVPNRSHFSRVSRILDAPNASTDELLQV